MFHLSCVTQPDFLPPEPRLRVRPASIMSSLSLSLRSALWLIVNPSGEFTSDRLWRCQVQAGSGCRLLAHQRRCDESKHRHWLTQALSVPRRWRDCVKGPSSVASRTVIYVNAVACEKNFFLTGSACKSAAARLRAVPLHAWQATGATEPSVESKMFDKNKCISTVWGLCS